jgi:uncharacterized metal-binding protein
MIKKKYFSAYDDLKTGILYKLFILIGILFFLTFIILTFISRLAKIDNNPTFLKYLYDLSISNFPGILLSFSIILIFVGLILYFFKRQFEKLADIAYEIEQNHKK